MTDHPSKAEQEAWMDKYRRGPAGLLLYRPVGGEPMTPRQFAVQIAGDVAIGLVAAVLLAGTGCWMRTFLARVGFVSLLGVLPFLAINLPYWNWYGFPATFTLAQLADRLLGFVIVGLVLAAIVKPVPAEVAVAAEPQRQPA
jgi:hypothetical protein